MNKEDLNGYRKKLPLDMYVILLKPDGEDGVSLAVIDTHNIGDNHVDLSYILSRGVLSLLANDMDMIKERGQSVILEEMRNETKLPIIDSLMDRTKPTARVQKDNIVSIFGEDTDDKQ
tara:strand:- start:1282 stop:1635 length:354 start_codon:yes stop_codon:yes gene_type:complete